MTTDPSDIVERLLDVADLDARAGEPLGKACREAAAEIERLRAALAAETEECARVADSTHEHIKNPVYNPLWLAGYREAQSNIAAAIRARGR